MDVVRRKEIVATLAEGVDPTTGEILPDDRVYYNKGDVVRALYAVLESLETTSPKRELPKNENIPWFVGKASNLNSCFVSGLSK